MYYKTITTRRNDISTVLFSYTLQAYTHLVVSIFDILFTNNFQPLSFYCITFSESKHISARNTLNLSAILKVCLIEPNLVSLFDLPCRWYCYHHHQTLFY